MPLTLMICCTVGFARISFTARQICSSTRIISSRSTLSENRDGYLPRLSVRILDGFLANMQEFVAMLLQHVVHLVGYVHVMQVPAWHLAAGTVLPDVTRNFEYLFHSHNHPAVATFGPYFATAS